MSFKFEVKEDKAKEKEVTPLVRVNGIARLSGKALERLNQIKGGSK